MLFVNSALSLINLQFDEPHRFMCEHSLHSISLLGVFLCILGLEKMNFTPNQARVPQQQVHQVPLTASEGGNMQKNINMPNQAFPVNSQAANLPQKLNEDHNKIQMPHHSVQQTGQNNNNHGLGGIPQIVNAQNINRSVNSGPLLQQSTQPMMTNISQAGQKSNVGLFQQISQMSQLYQSAAMVQSQQPLHLASLPSQNILQKLQATIPQVGHQMKPAPVQLASQQQMKTVLPPTPQQPVKPLQLPVSQQNMQYSPPKQHPQMKTTAKLASPGSQLQILQQKSPTAPHPPHPLGQQATQKQQNVPSTPPPVSAAPLAPPAAASPPKTQALPAQSPAKTIVVPVVPSTPVTIAPSQLPAKPAPAPVASEPAPTKAVEQPKETQPQAAAPSKPVPKLEEKKPAPAEANNKVEKLAAPAAGKPVVAVSTPSKNTMRLATVTPARQKKPPPTKPPVAPATPSVPKSTVKAATPAKPVEAPKTPTAKKSPVAKAAPAAGQSSSTSTATTPKTKRSRNKVQPFQSPTPELALVTKLSTQIANSSNKNGTEDNKLTIFYK